MIHNDSDLRYLQRTPAGAEYVRQISAQESDRQTRSAFRDLVLGTAPPGAKLFDFGAGPGLDARFFAELGFTIEAYDVDPRMREFFADHCRDLIDAGRIALDSSAYREFLARGTAGRRADLIISNFAPLNLVDDLRELFGKFDALTDPKGKVLASVLNPYFIGDMRSRLWWRGAPRLWRDGELFLPGPQAPYYRRLLRHFRTASAPHFQVSRVFSNGVDLRRGGRFAWVGAARCRYLFLLFEKTVWQ
ncbi:MAG TPA: methyltransferase domain-containing protein [Candidatus Acidoferrales bacterium]|jgi:SAM-dependent methyltransferase